MKSNSLPTSDAVRTSAAPLLASAVLTLALWRVPFGELVLYPCTILATWFHEMGHGLTALLLGGDFHSLVLLPNGSGIAQHSGVRFGRLGAALVAAGGPLGPAIAGALFITAARYANWGKAGLRILGALLLISAFVWIDGAFGKAIGVGLGLLMIAFSQRATPDACCFAQQFLGVQACLSTWRQLDYLFTRDATIGGRAMPSDSQVIAQSLLLPYWFWGGLLAVATIGLLGLSLSGGKAKAKRR